MTSHPALLLPLSVALGCASTSPAPRSNPPPTPAPVVVETRDASAPVADPPGPRFRGATVRFEAPWPQPDLPTLRFAVVTPADEPEARTAIAWETAPGRGGVGVSSPFAATVRVLRVSILDATGDGTPDAVVWIDPASLPPEQIPHAAEVFTFDGPEREPRRAAWTSLALGVVADDDALRAAVPTLRRFVPPESAATMDAVMLRLGYATAAQFRAMVAPGGIAFCDGAAGNARPHARRCRTYAPAAVTDAVFAERVVANVALAGGSGDPDREPRVDDLERCRTVGARVVCAVPTGGPALIDVVFTGPPSARRIARVETTVYEDS